jgi:hypothetical protein
MSNLVSRALACALCCSVVPATVVFTAPGGELEVRYVFVVETGAQLPPLAWGEGHVHADFAAGGFGTATLRSTVS